MFGRRRTPPVDTSLYDSTYLLRHCGGHEIYARSGGARLDERLSVLLDLADIRPGMRVLDVGCGRGELGRHAAERGARVWGMDLSPQALAVSRQTLSRMVEEEGRTVGLCRASAERLPFREGKFQRVLLSDILEHLTPGQLREAVLEVHRVLSEDGLVVFHTFPNRWFYTCFYPLKRLLWDMARGQAGPRNPRTPYERTMHVNELSPAQLHRVFRPRFQIRMWCAHRSRWDPSLCRFRRSRGPLDWFTQPEMWGVGEKRIARAG